MLKFFRIYATINLYYTIYQLYFANERDSKMTKRLEGLLETVKGHRVFIQTHNFPDPDALASAFGLQRLLGYFGIKAEIIYQGAVSKASIAGMVSNFGIVMTEIDKVEDMTADDYIITVDSQPNNTNIAESRGTIVACIDHHPTITASDHPFRDVRICGSCATLVADYFFANDIVMDVDTATILLYGLRMDTESFNRGVTDLDIEIFRKLFYLCDEDKLKKLSNHQMEFSELKAYTEALSTITVYDGVGFAFIDSQASDGLIASVCDFMLTLVEIQFAVAYGYRGNGLKFSIRSSLDYLDAGTIASNALEDIGSGGGHAIMAGGYLPFENIIDADFDLQEELQNRFMNAVYFSRQLQNALADPLEGIGSKSSEDTK